MIVAGFGFRSAATADSLRDALAQTGRLADALATAEDKAKTAAFQSFASGLNLPVHAIPATDLKTQTTLSQSDASQSQRGTGSVAEAAALAAAGPKARLLAPRVISSDRLATCALAERDP